MFFSSRASVCACLRRQVRDYREVGTSHKVMDASDCDGFTGRGWQWHVIDGVKGASSTPHVVRQGWDQHSAVDAFCLLLYLLGRRGLDFLRLCPLFLNPPNHVGSQQTGNARQEANNASANLNATAAVAHSLARPNRYSQPDRKALGDATIASTISPGRKEKRARF